ncbi:hypothetical protein Tco_1449905, partial [Tanacetum coccineum]
MSIYPMPSTFVKKLESMRNQFFLGGDIDERKMSWVRWNKCLASKDLGGLKIGSISGLNTGLLFKWIWRFLYSSSTLWVRVIKSIHGPHGCINDNSPCRFSYNTWRGSSTRFWEDVWRQTLEGPGIEWHTFELQQAKIEHVTLSDHGDSWLWTLDSSGFSVASIR